MKFTFARAICARRALLRIQEQKHHTSTARAQPAVSTGRGRLTSAAGGAMTRAGREGAAHVTHGVARDRARGAERVRHAHQPAEMDSGGFQAHFPPAVTSRPLLSAPAAAIECDPGLAFKKCDEARGRH